MESREILQVEMFVSDKRAFQTTRVNTGKTNAELFRDFLHAYKYVKRLEAKREATKEAVS